MDAAHSAVSARFTSDPWQERIEEYLRPRGTASATEIFKIALNMPDIGKWSPQEMNRMARCVAFAGWTRVRRGNTWIFVPQANATEAERDFQQHELGL